MREKLIGIINEICGRNDIDYDNCDLLSSGTLDSLGVMMLVTALSEQLDVDIDIDDLNLDNFANLDSIVSLIERSK